MKYLALILAGIFLLASCADETSKDNEVTPEKVVEKDTVSEKPVNLVRHSHDVLLAIASKDFQSLSHFVHPDKGVIFAPYAFIDSLAKSFTAYELKNMTPKYPPVDWGQYDGSGEPMNMNISQYFDKIVYDVDYLTADTLAVNGIIGKGNSINNIKTVFPESEFVEYHFRGFDPEFDGMDWRSLRLVYEKVENKYFLVAIVNDRWTI